MDATTVPVVGEMVSVPSELATELTAPLPDPHGLPVEPTTLDAMFKHPLLKPAIVAPLAKPAAVPVVFAALFGMSPLSSVGSWA